MHTHTKLSQSAITPSLALEILKEGNARFVKNLGLNRNLLQQVNETSEGQWPFAAILSCIDSRTSAELIFDQGLGDVFSIRIAGNIINEDILGSMEFACKIAGAKLIVVLGHTRCGAIRSACDGHKMGNLTGLLNKIQPAVDAETSITSNRSSLNTEFVNLVTIINIRRVVGGIIQESPIIQQLVENGEVGIVGGLYEVETGKVYFYPEAMVIK